MKHRKHKALDIDNPCWEMDDYLPIDSEPISLYDNYKEKDEIFKRIETMVAYSAQGRSLGLYTMGIDSIWNMTRVRLETPTLNHYFKDVTIDSLTAENIYKARNKAKLPIYY